MDATDAPAALGTVPGNWQAHAGATAGGCTAGAGNQAVDRAIDREIDERAAAVDAAAVDAAERNLLIVFLSQRNNELRTEPFRLI